MEQPTQQLQDCLAQLSKLDTEISITAKWVPREGAKLPRKGQSAAKMRQVLQTIHSASTNESGVALAEISLVVGDESVLVHHVFKDEAAVVGHFATAAQEQLKQLRGVATPGLHMVRGIQIPVSVRDAITSQGLPSAFGELLFGYLREGSGPSDTEAAIMVTAKWACKPGYSDNLELLKRLWQDVGNEAFSTEPGLLRFEVYKVVGQDALLIHEVFENNAELKFHLTKGTAKKYKKAIDGVATPESYFFRGPVSWLIRTYSKILRLPATYSSSTGAFSGDAAS